MLSLLLSYVVVCFFFFFQAEDGIRDIGVTGVQTCALPIYTVLVMLEGREDPWMGHLSVKGKLSFILDFLIFEIGRASCRERV